MTKDELKTKVLDMYWGHIGAVKVLTAVDEFEQALLQQTPCSKPLELLQSIAEEQVKLMQPGMAESQIKEASKNLKHLAAVKKLIQEHSPMA